MSKLNSLQKLIERRKLKEDLTHIIETPEGQRFLRCYYVSVMLLNLYFMQKKQSYENVKVVDVLL